jgi:arsenite transporter
LVVDVGFLAVVTVGSHPAVDPADLTDRVATMMAIGLSDASPASVERMHAGGLERYQVWVYLAAVGAGLLLGSLAPELGGPAETVLWPVLVALLYVTFVQVPLWHLRPALRDTRFSSAALVGNFMILPLAIWLLVQVLPDDPAVRLGVLLVLLVPCTDWFITFTGLAGGDVPRAIALSPVNLLLQLLLLPAYLFVLADTEVTATVGVAQAAPALAIVLVPLVLAAVTERWVEARPERRGLRDGLGRAPVPLLALVVLLIATAQVETVLRTVRVLPVIVPVFVAFLVIALAVAMVLARLFALPPRQARTLAFSLGTRNSFVVLPLALALPAGLEAAAVVIVVQSLVELLGMVAYLWCVPRVFAVEGAESTARQ